MSFNLLLKFITNGNNLTALIADRDMGFGHWSRLLYYHQARRRK